MDVSEFVSIHTDAGRPGVATVVLSRPPTNALTRQSADKASVSPAPSA